jgi:hypothetical protein
MRRQSQAILPLVLALALALAACGTQKMYDESSEGGQLPALIETPSFTSGIALIEVDGERVNPFQSHSVEVLPGNHSFHIWLQDRQFGELVHALWPAISATVGSDYYCAKFQAMVEPGRSYEIQPSSHGLVLRSDRGDIATRITAINAVPFGNIMTSTPTECNSVGSAPYELSGHLAEPTASSGETSKSNTVPPAHESSRILSTCSEGKVPDKPWVGKWMARLDNAILTFEIEEEVIRGDLKSGSRDFSITGKVDNEGAISGAIFGKNSFDRMNAHGIFPHLKLSYPYGTPQSPVFKVLDGQTLRLCS